MNRRDDHPKTYRLLDNQRTVLSWAQIATLIREGLLDTSTVVIGEGETFAVAISARPEFRGIFVPRRTRSPRE